jgi:hypothetical protein
VWGQFLDFTKISGKILGLQEGGDLPAEGSAADFFGTQTSPPRSKIADPARKKTAVHTPAQNVMIL